MAVALLLVAVVVYGRGWFAGEVPIEQVLSEAREAPDALVRQQAAVRVVDRSAKDPIRIQELYAASADPGVRAICLRATADHYHYESFEMVLAGLEDPSPAVRAAAAQAAGRLTGMFCRLDPNGPPAERQRLVAFYRQQWNLLRDSPRLAEFRQEVSRRKGGR